MAEKPQWVKFVVRLTAAERVDLQRLVDEGKRAGSVLKRAWVLLKADADGPNWKDPERPSCSGSRCLGVCCVPSADFPCSEMAWTSARRASSRTSIAREVLC